MATPNYYNILGVARNASQDDVKKAYRGLARQWHPDRNPNNDEAAQRFKDITEAYKTLSDAERRSRYDRLGPLYTEDGRPPRPEDINEVVGTMFGNLFRRKRGAKRGDDLRYTISLSLEEVAVGCDKEIIVPRKVSCAPCAGSGADVNGGRTKCTVCGGSGRSSGALLLRGDCYHCDGRGFVVTTPCPRCDGDGRVTLDDPLRVKVPMGVATGQKLKLAGKGDAPRGDGAVGDLLVVINVAEHELFRRRGDDLLVELPLTFSELTVGADVRVPTLEGTTTIRVPPASPAGKVLRLGGRGLPRVGRSGRGDLHLQLSLEVPEALSAPQRDALLAWARAIPAEAHPRRAAFDRALEDRE